MLLRSQFCLFIGKGRRLKSAKGSGQRAEPGEGPGAVSVVVPWGWDTHPCVTTGTENGRPGRSPESCAQSASWAHLRMALPTHPTPSYPHHMLQVSFRTKFNHLPSGRPRGRGWKWAWSSWGRKLRHPRIWDVGPGLGHTTSWFYKVFPQAGHGQHREDHACTWNRPCHSADLLYWPLPNL